MKEIRRKKYLTGGLIINFVLGVLFAHGLLEYVLGISLLMSIVMGGTFAVSGPSVNGKKAFILGLLVFVAVWLGALFRLGVEYLIRWCLSVYGLSRV